MVYSIQKAIVTNKKVGKYETLKKVTITPRDNYYKKVMLVAEQAGYKEEKQCIVRVVENKKIVWLGKFPNKKQREINLRRTQHASM